MLKQKIKVLFVGAELTPLVKVGGLGDVMGALPKSLVKQGVDVKIIIPFYGLIDKNKFKVKLFKKNLSLQIDQRKEKFDLYQTFLPGSKISVYLFKHKLFNSKEIYFGGSKYFKNGDNSKKIGDNDRFIFFSKAVAEVIKQLNWQLDLVHCHDWHTAMLPTFIDEYSLSEENFKNIKTLFTIHNLANQGIAPLDIVDYAGLHHNLTPALMEDYYDRDGDKIDMMKVGILSADLVNTVSPTYATEILTKEYGEKLEQYLLRRKKHLFGIVNGIDTNVFDPKTDKAISKKYGPNNFSSHKAFNKQALQTKLKLPNKDVPIFALISRLVSQKGLDILEPLWEKYLEQDLQIVILGTGEKKYEEALAVLNKKHPKKFKAVLKFDADLAQLIYAGSDFFLMPSSFEPCGLGQMIAMRYGTIPIVRATGGLKDTVKHKKTGFVFKDYNSKALEKVFDLSLKIFKDKKSLNKMIKNAMSQDFSWQKSALEYIELYKKLIK